MTTWRYQPVYVEQDGVRTVTLCEAYFDDQDRLTSWTERPAMEPQGETPEELARDLSRMLEDARRWRAVPFSELKAGMVLERVGEAAGEGEGEADSAVEARFADGMREALEEVRAWKAGEVELETRVVEPMAAATSGARYTVLIEPLSEADGGGFLATVPDLPGCTTGGETRADAAANVEGAIAEWLEAAAACRRDPAD